MLFLHRVKKAVFSKRRFVLYLSHGIHSEARNILIKMALARSLMLVSSQVKTVVRLNACIVNGVRNYSNGQQMSFTFAAPAELFYNNADVRQIDVPSFSGSFGILPKHVPVLAVLKPGVVTVFEKDGDAKKFFVSSGSIAVNEDSSVQIIAEEAVPIDHLDVQACKEGLANAQQQLAQATTEVAQAEAQINIEVHEALVKAAV